jgi:diguanylate cyclase (GGDEF)-like protein
MNRRRHPRLDIDHPAGLTYDGECYDRCRIRNFSKGGLYIQLADGRLGEKLPDGYFTLAERRHGVIDIQPEGIRVKVSIVYLHGEGLGLAFDDPASPALFEALMSSLRASPRSSKGVSQGVKPDIQLSQRLLQLIRGSVSDYIQARLKDFFLAAQQDLLALASEIGDTRDESGFYFTYNTLEKRRGVIDVQFRNELDKRISEMCSEDSSEIELPEDLPAELALVEKQEIDTWILFNDAARQVEDRLAANLGKLESALRLIIGHVVTAENNPVSPISLLGILRDTLQAYDLKVQSIQIILAAFQKSLLNDLNYLYQKLLQLLQPQLGELPKGQGGGGWTIVGSQGEVIQSQGERSIQQLSSLAQMQPDLKQTQDGDNRPVAEPEVVVESLDRLASKQGTTIATQLQDELDKSSSAPRKLSLETQAAIGAGDELISALCNDSMMAPELCDLLERLKILVIESILQDPSLLDNEDHPVRQLLAAIESMMPYLSPLQRRSQMKDRDRQRLTDVIKKVESGEIKDLDGVKAQVVELQQELEQRFEKNRGLAISRCEKDENLNQAHTAVLTALKERLSGRSVSRVIDNLFKYGWANLLVQTYVLHGEASAGWKAYLLVLDILVKTFEQNSTREIPEKEARHLVSLIRKGFRDYPVYAAGSKEFARNLQQALLLEPVKFQGYIQDRITVDEAYLLKQFSNMQSQVLDDDEIAIDPQAQELLDRLRLGGWLILNQDLDSPGMLCLAWVNSTSTRYLLIDGEGFKALDLSHKEMAERLRSRELIVLEDQRKPIVERAIDQILARNYETVSSELASDDLTGLMNRRSFDQELRKRLHEIETDQGQHVLLLLDLDKFQAVNDLSGIEGGDRLLREISDILLSFLPDKGVLARIGDDEFALLLEDRDLEQGYQISETLRSVIDEYQFIWDGRRIPVSASIGLVYVDSVERTPGELLQAALAACNLAKRNGRNCIRVYQEDAAAYQEQRQMVQSLPGIKEALAENRLVLFAQPIVPLNPDLGLIPHYEILLRIRNPDGELESPVDFIRAAEHYDMMRAVDRWVVEAFLSAIKPLARSFHEEASFSVNISGKSLSDTEFKHFLKQAVMESGIDTSLLGFEITETALVGDISDTAEFIDEIRQMGCNFSLDDFGTGYASFSYLKDFPVDFVKIDGIFVREILNKPADYAMINSITEIAHFMDKKVIAEFVTDAEIANALTTIGVDYGQGYHFSKPRPLHEIFSEITDSATEMPADLNA